MSGIYSVDDLLKLRASPLICKPPNLPAIEEWMGAQEPSGRRPLSRVTKEETTSVQGETFQKRPALTDAHRRTTTDPDRIVLGPPRRSFASSNARTFAKAQEASEEKDRATFGEKPRNGDETETRSHDRRHAQTNGRYGNRHESEEPESGSRPDYERRPKWAGRDRNENDQELEQSLEESARGPRRDTQSRAKLSQSWFRRDGGDADDDKAPDWRRDRGRDREWDRDRNARIEAEPEWMDSGEPDEPFQAHTQEDFQRWKERMKAGGTAQPEKIETNVATPPVQEKRVVSAELDDSMDKFLARFESQATEQKAATIKVHGKSKFASLFSPVSEQSKQVEFPMQATPTNERPPSAHASGATTDADQAGFARILEMLQTRSNNPTPQVQEAPKPKTPLYARGNEQPELAKPADKLSRFFSGGQTVSQQEPLEQQRQSAQSQQSVHHRAGDVKSPVEPSTHSRQQSSINKDELLLNLLRQASLAHKPQPAPPTGSGMFGVPSEAEQRPPNSRSTLVSPIQADQPAYRGAPRSHMFDESPIGMYSAEQVPREQAPRRATNGAQPAYGDDGLIALLRSQAANPRAGLAAQNIPQAYHPGLQRPPGFDQGQRPNPNWAGQQPSRQSNLPPGLANQSRPMSGAPYGQPQQIPIQQPQQQRAQQLQPQRKYTADSSLPPNLPPGMYPPPGFMNAGPPPGFPGAMANHPGAARFGGDPGPQQRPIMDMYAEVGGRGIGLRGGAGNGGMPPYR